MEASRRSAGSTQPALLEAIRVSGSLSSQSLRADSYLRAHPRRECLAVGVETRARRRLRNHEAEARENAIGIANAFHRVMVGRTRIVKA